MSDCLDNSLADLGHAETRIAAELLPHYGADTEPVQANPLDDCGQTDDQRGEQTITLLLLLGYLHEPASQQTAAGAPTWTWSAEDIDTAWATWKQDRLALAFSPDPDLTIATENSGLSIDRESRLRRDLKACATLEGEALLTRWPTPGNTSLASRILMMRLHLYGLENQPAHTPLRAGLDADLVARAQWITAEEPLSAADIINSLGCIRDLTTKMQAKKQLHDRFIILQSPDSPQKLPPVENLDSDRAEQIHALNLSQKSSAAWNRFSIRLLQVRLWTLGYYQGEVDGNWAAMSQAALDNFMKDFRLAQPSRLRGSVQGGYVVLDITGLLAVFTNQVDTPAHALERETIDSMLSTAEVQNNPELWEQLQALHSNRQPTNAKYVDDDFQIVNTENLRRKRYFGWRGIFASFGRFLKKVADTAARFVSNLLTAIKQGLGYVRNIVRYIIDTTRAAVRVAALAVRRLHCWMTGTPVATFNTAGQLAAATFWQHDFDTVNLISQSCPPALLRKHTQVLDWMQRSVGLMLDIGTKVLSAILAFGNWLLLAWRVLKVIHSILVASTDPLFGELLAESNVI